MRPRPADRLPHRLLEPTRWPPTPRTPPRRRSSRPGAALPRFRAGAPFRPWLLAIVANEARSRRRAVGPPRGWTARAAARRASRRRTGRSRATRARRASARGELARRSRRSASATAPCSRCATCSTCPSARSPRSSAAAAGTRQVAAVAGASDRLRGEVAGVRSTQELRAARRRAGAAGDARLSSPRCARGWRPRRLRVAAGGRTEPLALAAAVLLVVIRGRRARAARRARRS